MSSPRPDGGQAYPGSTFSHLDTSDGSGTPIYAPHDGMSMRDYFAGQALVGLVSFDRPHGPGGDNAPKHFARWAYALADAMLEERSRG